MIADAADFTPAVRDTSYFTRAEAKVCNGGKRAMSGRVLQIMCIVLDCTSGCAKQVTRKQTGDLRTLRDPGSSIDQ